MILPVGGDIEEQARVPRVGGGDPPVRWEFEIVDKCSPRRRG